jgi:hypothetical protein
MGKLAKPLLKELESRAEQVGLVHAMAFLRRISAADLADYVVNEGIRSDLRQAYAAAVAEVGENKAMKKAVYAAYIKAEQTVLGARATGYRPVLEAAQQAVRVMLTEQPPIRPRVTVNGRPQSVPESSDSIERRFRLFYESARRLADDPLAQPGANGHLLGKSSGLERLVSAIAPLFQREQSLIRWVALRGAVASLHNRTLGGNSPEAVITLTEAMGLRLVPSQDGGISVTPLAGDQPPGPDHSAALALGNIIYGFLWDYERIAKMSLQDASTHPPFATLTDAQALDCIAWAAAGLGRIGLAQQIVPNVPEPDALTAPGWYVDPVFARFERYWDGSDWTPEVRNAGQQGTVPLR